MFTDTCTSASIKPGCATCTLSFYYHLLIYIVYTVLSHFADHWNIKASKHMKTNHKTVDW